MKIKNAGGTEGMLLRGMDGKSYFRVYDKNEDGEHIKPPSFTDYDILHHDLAVTIDRDFEAAFYYPADGSAPFLDHVPETLGLKGKSDAKIEMRYKEIRVAIEKTFEYFLQRMSPKVKNPKQRKKGK